jgi:hypothetical protein
MFSQELLQLPLIKSGGQCAQKGATAGGRFAAWPLEKTARRLTAPRSRTMSRCGCPFESGRVAL